MEDNKLKLKPDKTEFILIGTEHNRDQLLPFCPTDILGNNLKPVDKVRNLDLIFDSDLSFSQLIQALLSFITDSAVKA
jgi:hypothetical protein